MEGLDGDCLVIEADNAEALTVAETELSKRLADISLKSAKANTKEVDTKEAVASSRVTEESSSHDAAAAEARRVEMLRNKMVVAAGALPPGRLRQFFVIPKNTGGLVVGKYKKLVCCLCGVRNVR